MDDVLCVAKCFYDYYYEEHGHNIDEMKMHKLMYFAQRESFIEYDKPLFSARFYGWKFGPVLKEVREESGIQHVKALSEEIFSLEVLSVDSHYRRGIYVPTHMHLNVTYLLQADEKDELIIKEDENANVAWFSLDEALKRSTEKWFVENIYSKLNQKLRMMYGID